jgi:hypothetical protein
MNIDDDEVIPIRDLTKNQSLFNLPSSLLLADSCVERITCGNSPSKDKQSKVLQTLDRPVNEPKKLANGHYEYYGRSDQCPSNSLYVSRLSGAAIHAKQRQNVDICGPSGMLTLK